MRQKKTKRICTVQSPRSSKFSDIILKNSGIIVGGSYRSGGVWMALYVNKLVEIASRFSMFIDNNFLRSTEYKEIFDLLLVYSDIFDIY